jgi:hypothetical protein
MRIPAPMRKTIPEPRRVKPTQPAGIQGVNRRREKTPVRGRMVNIRINDPLSNQEFHDPDSLSVILSSFH